MRNGPEAKIRRLGTMLYDAEAYHVGSDVFGAIAVAPNLSARGLGAV